MANDDSFPYEVVAPEGGAELSDDGAWVKLTFLMKDGPLLSLAIPSQYMLPLAAMTFVAANQAYAVAGTLANQRILLSEGVDVRSDREQIDLYFRLSGTKTEIPVSLSRHTARSLLEQLTASLAQG